MTLIRNGYTHPYTTGLGRVLAIGEVANVDVSSAQDQDAISTGGLFVMDPDYEPPATPTPPLTGDWRAPVATFDALPATGNQPGDVRLAFDSGVLYRWSGSAWGPISGGSGDGSGNARVLVWDGDVDNYTPGELRTDISLPREFVGPVDPFTIPSIDGPVFGDRWTPTEALT